MGAGLSRFESEASDHFAVSDGSRCPLLKDGAGDRYPVAAPRFEGRSPNGQGRCFTRSRSGFDSSATYQRALHFWRGAPPFKRKRGVRFPYARPFSCSAEIRHLGYEPGKRGSTPRREANLPCALGRRSGFYPDHAGFDYRAGPQYCARQWTWRRPSEGWMRRFESSRAHHSRAATQIGKATGLKSRCLRVRLPRRAPIRAYSSTRRTVGF